MPKARNQEVLQKGSYAQDTMECTWSSGESLLLLAHCTGGNGVPSVVRANIP